MKQTLPLRALLAGARKLHNEQIALIKRLAAIESPSDDAAATRKCLNLAAEMARALGGRVALRKAPPSGGILSAQFGARRVSHRVLLLGHLDTVWPLGTLKAMPIQQKGEVLFGPGVLDMKAGVAMALTAIKLLSGASGFADGKAAVHLLLTTDEETGSHASRRAIEAPAQDAAAVFVLEPAQGQAYKTARKGTGNWRLDVQGRAAHAGVDFEKGRSAILELARQLERIAGFTDLKRGITVSTGKIGGGGKTNVIPAHAWAEGDLRIARQADAARILKRFGKLRPVEKDCALALKVEINRPPMERTRGTARLFEQARTLARELDWNLEEAATGGASDGNFTSALGAPTLDGMGAAGSGAHALHEQIDLGELPRRTALLAAMIAQQAAG
jgi:glutamate carboxypeptidase